MQAVWSACESCMCACLATRRLGCDTKRVQRAQRTRCLARSTSLPRRCNERSLLCITKERTVLQDFSGASFSHGVFNLWGLEATCLQSRLRVRSACHAELSAGERREASERLRARLAFLFLGKAKRFVIEWTICRCNASEMRIVSISCFSDCVCLRP